MAENLAQEGRSTDSVVGHLTPGEIVVPKEMLSNATLRKSLVRAFKEHGADIDEFTVGHDTNKINPTTGYPEFFIDKVFKGAKKAVKSVTRSVKGFVSSAERKIRRTTYGRMDYLAQKGYKLQRRQTAAELREAELRMQAERDRLVAAHEASMEQARAKAKKAKAKETTRGILMEKEHQARLGSLNKPNLAVSDQTAMATPAADSSPSFKRRARRKKRRAVRYGDRRPS